MVSSEVLPRGLGTLIPASAPALEDGKRWQSETGWGDTTDSEVLKPGDPQRGEKWRQTSKVGSGVFRRRSS